MPVNSARNSPHRHGYLPNQANNSTENWAKTRTATEVVLRFGWRIQRLMQSYSPSVTVVRAA
jgi:hypothetical protein